MQTPSTKLKISVKNYLVLMKTNLFKSFQYRNTLSTALSYLELKQLIKQISQQHPTS